MLQQSNNNRLDLNFVRFSASKNERNSLIDGLGVRSLGYAGLTYNREKKLRKSGYLRTDINVCFWLKADSFQHCEIRNMRAVLNVCF